MTTLTRTQLEVLTEALKRMDDDTRNTDAFFARDKDGRNVDPTDPEAVCWCYLGHLKKSIGDQPPHDDGSSSIYGGLITLTYEILNKERGVLASITETNDQLGTAYLRDLVRAKLSDIEVVD